MLKSESEKEYKEFEGFVLEKKKKLRRYTCSSEMPINVFVRDKSESEFSELPLTESNIERICNQFNMKCNISDHIIFLRTNCGYWRLYLNGEKVSEVFHTNYKMKKSEYRKKKKCNEGFHQQKISHTNFYDVVRYIYYHDRDLYKKCK